MYTYIERENKRVTKKVNERERERKRGRERDRDRERGTGIGRERREREREREGERERLQMAPFVSSIQCYSVILKVQRKKKIQKMYQNQ